MATAFISYGGPDEEFASKLNRTLNDAGIKTFFFPIDAKPGEKLHHLMRNGVNTFEKIVFICSKNSLERPGVLNELEQSLQREAREGGEQILIPINLDDYVFTTWAPQRAGLKQEILDRVVGNFIGVNFDNHKYISAATKLVSVLGGVLENTYISWDTTLHLNETGDSCLVKIERSFISYIERTQLVYHGLNSTGKIVPVSVSDGEIEKIETEGGNKAIYVNFANPLPVNEVINHFLLAEHQGAFTENTESYSNHALVEFEEFSIKINFPKARPVKDAQLKTTYNGKVTTSKDGVQINPDKDLVILRLKKPKVGAFYTLEWQW